MRTRKETASFSCYLTFHLTFQSYNAFLVHFFLFDISFFQSIRLQKSHNKIDDYFLLDKETTILQWNMYTNRIFHKIYIFSFLFRIFLKSCLPCNTWQLCKLSAIKFKTKIYNWLYTADNYLISLICQQLTSSQYRVLANFKFWIIFYLRLKNNDKL